MDGGPPQHGGPARDLESLRAAERSADRGAWGSYCLSCSAWWSGRRTRRNRPAERVPV